MIQVRLNARFRGRPLTGVERFAMEVSTRLCQDGDVSLSETAPARPLAGLKGHAWEQFILPGKLAKDEVLFSPCNTGPIRVGNQLVVIHDAAVWDHPEGFSTTFRTVYQQLLPRLAKKARAVATVSQFSRSRLAPHLGIPEEKILVLGNAVGPAFTPGDTLTDRHKLLCVGSMDPRKNFGRLLRAWKSLADQGGLPKGARLQLVGGANPRNFAGMDRIEGSGIEWLGRIDDAELVRCYREAGGFVYPSLYEGFGLPPLEAMACGCPVLLSHAASLPEVGGPAEDGAVIYLDPESEDDIARAILDFFSLDEAELAAMRSAALKRSALFSWDSIAREAAGAMRAIT